jgi:hypothetical protein
MVSTTSVVIADRCAPLEILNQHACGMLTTGKVKYVLVACFMVSGITRRTEVLIGAVLTHFKPSP